METFMIRKEFVSMCMESPLYFTMPLHQRLKFLKKLENGSLNPHVRENYLQWVKTGYFHHPDRVAALDTPEDID